MQKKNFMKFMKMETVVGYIIGMNTFSDGFTTHEIFYLSDLFGGFYVCTVHVVYKKTTTAAITSWKHHGSRQKLKFSNLHLG